MIYNFQLFEQLILKLILTLLTCAKVYRHSSIIFSKYCFCTWFTLHLALIILFWKGSLSFFFRQRTANEWWVLFWMMYNFQLFKQLILKLIVTLLTCAKVYRHFSMIFFTHCYCTWSTSLLEGFAFDRFRQWTANE